MLGMLFRALSSKLVLLAPSNPAKGSWFEGRSSSPGILGGIIFPLWLKPKSREEAEWGEPHVRRSVGAHRELLMGTSHLRQGENMKCERSEQQCGSSRVCP